MIKLTPTEIITRKMNTEGFNISKKSLVNVALTRLQMGLDMGFHYSPNIVFTCSLDSEEGHIHLYAYNSRTALFRAMHQFMDEVWKNTRFNTLTCPIKNPTLQKFVGRFGWKECGQEVGGFTIYKIERT